MMKQMNNIIAHFRPTEQYRKSPASASSDRGLYPCNITHKNYKHEKQMRKKECRDIFDYTIYIRSEHGKVKIKWAPRRR